MVEKPDVEYRIVAAVPPGDTIAEEIAAIGMKQVDLARRTGRTPQNINRVIKGEESINADLAIRLERVLGVPAHFWLALESNYRAALAIKRERVELGAIVEWTRNFPVSALVAQGYVPKTKEALSVVKALLEFFGVASPDEWEKVWMRPSAVYRSSPVFARSPYSLAVWLRIGEIEAKKIKCGSFTKGTFEQVLNSVRALSARCTEEVLNKEVVDRCATAGVAVVYVPELPKTRVSGATRWLTSDKAVLQMSLRYRNDDQFWFTFFHEAAHILIHGKSRMFIDGRKDGGTPDGLEWEANNFAANYLIPPKSLERFVNARDFSKAAVCAFAQRLGIAPGIVVGRLQHDGHVPFSHLNGLKRQIYFVKR